MIAADEYAVYTGTPRMRTYWNWYTHKRETREWVDIGRQVRDVSDISEMAGMADRHLFRQRKPRKDRIVDRIEDAIREAGRPLTSVEISDRINVNRSSVWRAINQYPSKVVKYPTGERNTILYGLDDGTVRI